MAPMADPVPTMFDAWLRSAYAPEGFWRVSSPAAPFPTASTLGPELGEAVAALLDRHPRIARVVEVGAGDGLLLRALHAAAGRRHRPLQRVGIDLRPRPPALPASVAWAQDCWDVKRGGWSGPAAT